MNDTANLETYLPLSPAAFHLLISLASGDRHGWAIRKEVEQRTDGEIVLGPGTLYGLIKRLLRQELIAESEQRPPFQWDDERRRYYRLTTLGRRVAVAETERMEKAVALSKQLRLDASDADLLSKSVKS